MIAFVYAAVKISDTGVTIEPAGLAPSSESEESFSFHGTIVDRRHCNRVSIAGSAVFQGDDYVETIDALRP